MDDSLPPSFPSSGQRHARVMKTAIPIRNQLSTASQKSEIGWYHDRLMSADPSVEGATSTCVEVYAALFSACSLAGSGYRSTTVSIVSKRPMDPLEDFLEWSGMPVG
jgi:hypothetical protein